MGLKGGEVGLEHRLASLFSSSYLSLQSCLEGSAMPACHSWMETGKHEDLEEPQGCSWPRPTPHPVVAWGDCAAWL